MKKVLDLLTVYVVISALGIFFYENIYDIAYSHYEFITYSIPMIAILMVLSSTFYFFHKEFLDLEWYKKKNEIYLLYWISVFPYFFLSVYSLFKASNIWKINSIGFILFVISAVLLEEFVFRRVTFIEMKKNYGTLKAIFGSSFIFAIFHVLSFLTDRPLSQMPSVIIMAFFTGISYACTYLYTKNLGLLVLKRSLWNCMRLSDIQWSFWLLAVMFVFEYILCVLMLIKSERAFAKNIEVFLKKTPLKKYFINS